MLATTDLLPMNLKELCAMLTYVRKGVYYLSSEALVFSHRKKGCKRNLKKLISTSKCYSKKTSHLKLDYSLSI